MDSCLPSCPGALPPRQNRSPEPFAEDTEIRALTIPGPVLFYFGMREGPVWMQRKQAIDPRFDFPAEGDFIFANFSQVWHAGSGADCSSASSIAARKWQNRPVGSSRDFRSATA